MTIIIIIILVRAEFTIFRVSKNFKCGNLWNLPIIAVVKKIIHCHFQQQTLCLYFVKNCEQYHHNKRRILPTIKFQRGQGMKWSRYQQQHGLLKHWYCVSGCKIVLQEGHCRIFVLIIQMYCISLQDDYGEGNFFEVITTNKICDSIQYEPRSGNCKLCFLVSPLCLVDSSISDICFTRIDHG